MSVSSSNAEAGWMLIKSISASVPRKWLRLTRLSLATPRVTIHCRLATDVRLTTSHRPPPGSATAARTCHRRPISGRLESAQPGRLGCFCLAVALLGFPCSRTGSGGLNSGRGCSVSLPLLSLTHQKRIYHHASSVIIIANLGAGCSTQ